MSCKPAVKKNRTDRRAPGATSGKAPHFPEVNPKGVVRLRDYQVDKHDEVLAHLAAGARVVPLVLPTGAGKTTICKAIASGWFTGGPDRLVIILGPTRAVVRQFQEPGPRIFNGHEDVPWRVDEDPQVGLPQPTPAQLVDLAWLSTTRGIFISTRQAWGRGLMLKKLADAPFEADGLCNLLVIADEAHHHHRKSAAGKLVAEIERRGATVIPVTATPYYELGPLFPPEVEGRAVRITATEFAQMTDEHGNPYCPREWDFTRHFVGESSDAADAYDTGAKRKGCKAQRALEACRAMAAKWAEDERPKAIFFLPERSWVAPMQRALAEVGAAQDRVVDFTGDDLSDDALELLDRERKVKRYQDSEVDAILSCARFDEGTDWPLCAVGYCWRIPDSVVRNLQRLGRTSRGKSKIEGYPERWKDVQTMRFFVRKLSGDGAAEAWRKHGELALVLGLFLADYREALKWARVVGSERGDRDADASGGSTPRQQPPRETDPLVLAKAKRQAMQLAQRPGAKGGYVVDGLRRDFPSIPLRQAKEIAALVVKARGVSEEEIARRRAKVQADLEAQAVREGRGAGWVREQYEERFASLMDEMLELPVEADGALLREIGLRFGAEEVDGFVERFRAVGTGGLPDLDIDKLFRGVPAVAAWCRAAASHPDLQVRPDVLAGFCLLVASAAVASRAALRIGDMITPAYLFGIGETTAAEGKSLPLRLAGLDLLVEHQNTLAAATARKRKLEERQREKIQEEIDKLKRKGQKAEGVEADAIDEQIVDLRERLETLRTPPLLYIANGDTPQAFENRMRDCRYALLAAAEGTTILRNFASAQGEGTGAKDYLDPLLYMYSEDDTGRGKVGEERRRLFKARGGLILAVQPTVLSPSDREDARMLSHLARRGLFSRTLLFRPRPYASGEVSPKSTDEERAPLRAEWERIVRTLLAPVAEHDHPLAPSNRTLIDVTPEARALFEAFGDEMKRATRPGGALCGEFTGTVAGRANEQAKRVALALRLIRRASEGEGIGPCEVGVEEAEPAIALLRDYVLPHAVAVAERAVYSPIDDDAARVLRVLREKGPTIKLSTFLDSHFKRGWSQQRNERRSRFDAAVGHLIARGLVAMTGGDRGQGERTYTLINRAAAKAA